MEKQTLLNRIQTTSKLKSSQEWVEFLALTDVHEIKEFFENIQSLIENNDIIETKKGKLQAIEHSDYVSGVLSINPKGYGFVDAEKESFYIPSYQFKTAMHGDTVLVKPRVFADLSKEGEIVKVLKRNTTQLVGTWHANSKQQGLSVSDPRITQTINVIHSDTSHLVDGAQVLVMIETYGEALDVVIKEVLGHVDDPGMDIQTLLLNHQIPLKFPEEVIQQVQSMTLRVQENELQGRVDYRKHTIVTIDGEDAKDFDDAIDLDETANGYILDVHIADVSAYVTERSPLDEEAKKRGTSVYVVDRVVPMLPHELSNGICSLIEGQDRLTLTCHMELDKQGNVLTYDIHPSVICSTRRMTYTQVNRILKGDTKTREQFSDLVELFDRMHVVAKLIRTQRRTEGSIEFKSVESKFVFNEDKTLHHIEARIQDIAENIIEDFMVLANETVAKHTKWLEIPSLYRVHERPDKHRFASFMKVARYFNVQVRYEHLTPKLTQGILNRFIGKKEESVINDLLLRSMAKAHYDSQCLGHFGLALEEYCHFTSPIRRYPDLIVHRMLRKHLFTQHPNERLNDAIEVERLGPLCSQSEERATQAERDVEAMKKAEYMEAHIGEKYPGIITGVMKFGFFVRLENTVEGLVHVSNLNGYYEYDEDRFSLVRRGSHQSYRLGQSVQIRVIAANKERQTIDFDVV